MSQSSVSTSSLVDPALLPSGFALANNTMGRTVDQEVHAAFVEFRAKEDDKVSPPNKKIIQRALSPQHQILIVISLKINSASPFSASIASKFGPRIPVARNNIFSSARACGATRTRLSRNRMHLPMASMPMDMPPPRMAVRDRAAALDRVPETCQTRMAR